MNCSQPFSISDILDGPEGKELTISPSSAQVVTNDTITFIAAGGVPPISANLFYSGKFQLFAFVVHEEYHSRILQLRPSAQKQMLSIEKALSHVKVGGT